MAGPTLEEMEIPGVRLAPNWTTAAGALEGILEHLGTPLPRHAVMGISGHAWHLCVSSREAVHVLPDGPHQLDWGAMVERYARLGWRWERFAAAPSPGQVAEPRDAAIVWAKARLDAGHPLIGWDFHLHEFAVVYGYDSGAEGFLVQSVVTPEVGPLAPWRDWPSALGAIELFAPVEPVEVEAMEVIEQALATAVELLDGSEPATGAAGFERWASLFESDEEIDRAGNAYTLAVVQAARADGADFLRDVGEAIPELGAPLGEAEREVRAVVKALAPLVTLFPFPSGGHGNVANPGLRRAAAMPLRRAAAHERQAAAAIRKALELLHTSGGGIDSTHPNV
jgi:hypothetical protein